MEIITDRFLLREVKAADVQNIHKLNSIPEVDRYNTLGIPATLAVSEKLVVDIIVAQAAEPRVRYVMAIINRQSGDFMGLIGLVMGKPNYQSAEIWYKLHPDFWSRGYATEAVKAVLNYGFNVLLLHRIEAGCAIENIASVKVLEKTGFTREAHTRKLLPIRGQWHDNYGYAILEEDFFSLG